MGKRIENQSNFPVTLVHNEESVTLAPGASVEAPAWAAKHPGVERLTATALSPELRRQRGAEGTVLRYV